MELALLVYLAGLIDQFKWLGIAITLLLVIPLVLLTLLYFMSQVATDPKDRKHKEDNTGKYIRNSLIILFCFMFFKSLIPTKETFTMMIGAYAGQKVIEHPKTSELFDKSLKAIETQLDVLIAPPKKTEKEEK